MAHNPRFGPTGHDNSEVLLDPNTHTPGHASVYFITGIILSTEPKQGELCNLHSHLIRTWWNSFLLICTAVVKNPCNFIRLMMSSPGGRERCEDFLLLLCLEIFNV